MDAHLFRIFMSALEPMLLGGKISKIQELEPGILVLSFYGGGEKRQLCIRFDRKQPFCFLSGSRLSAGKAPSAQIMRLRKYFTDRRVVSVVSQFCSRKLWLLAAADENKSGKAPWLCLDLAKGASLHFLDAAQHPQTEAPKWPDAGALGRAMENWRDWPTLTPSLRRSLQLLDEPERLALLEDLRAGTGNVFLYSREEKGEMAPVLVSAWPLPDAAAKNLRESEREDILAALAEAGQSMIVAPLFEKRNDNLIAPIRRRVKSLEKVLAKLDEDEKRLKTMLLGEADALAISQNIWRLDREAHESSLIVGDGASAREIALNKKLSLLENMNSLFHKAKRGKRGLAFVEERRREAREELAALQGATMEEAAELSSRKAREALPEKDGGGKKTGQAASALRKILPRNIAVFTSSDGYVLLRGKDAKGNRALRRFCAPHDLWVHVETGPGAHVAIRRPNPGQETPERVLDEAGALAANKSWLANSATAAVMFAEMRHVRPARNGPEGKMIIDRLLMTRTVPVNRELEIMLAANTAHDGK